MSSIHICCFPHPLPFVFTDYDLSSLFKRGGVTPSFHLHHIRDLHMSIIVVFFIIAVCINLFIYLSISVSVNLSTLVYILRCKQIQLIGYCLLIKFMQEYALVRKYILRERGHEKKKKNKMEEEKLTSSSSSHPFYVMFFFHIFIMSLSVWRPISNCHFPCHLKYWHSTPND